MRKYILLVLFLLLLPLWIRVALATVLLPVDRTEFAYVTLFGKHIATYDGGRDDEAGLHWRWPWPIQSVHTVDRRLQMFDVPETEILTHDPERQSIDRTLTMSAYLCWKIPDAPAVDRYLRRVGRPERAKELLTQRVSSQLGALVGRMRMDDLINEKPGHVESQMGELHERLMGAMKDRVLEEYGIELVDVRLRRHGYPQAVRPAIFERIASERNKKVAEYQSDGDMQAAKIRSEADREARQIIADARASEQKLKGQAEAEADRIRNDAHSKDPELYAFLRKLEEYQRILGDNKSLLLLSAQREMFDVLLSPPKPSTTPPVKSAPAALDKRNQTNP